MQDDNFEREVFISRWYDKEEKDMATYKINNVPAEYATSGWTKDGEPSINWNFSETQYQVVIPMKREKARSMGR